MCVLSCACDKYKSNPRISGVCFSFSLRAFFRVGASSVTHQKAWQENGGDLALVSGHLSVRVVGEVPRLEVDPQEGAEPVEHVRLRLWPCLGRVRGCAVGAGDKSGVCGREFGPEG